MRLAFMLPLAALLVATPLLPSCGGSDGTNDQDGQNDGFGGNVPNGSGGNGNNGNNGSGGIVDPGPSEPGASRQEGLAPLYVYFDGTEGLEPDDYINYTFQWDFDSTGTDPEGRHRTASGFLVGHVFELPGNYVTTLTIYDDSLEVIEELDWQIAVHPFEGDTIYVSAAGNDDNSGDIDAPLRSPLLAMQEMAAPNTRILLRAGDEFELPPGSRVEGEGPVFVGAYSDPDSPSTAPPILSSADTDSTYYVLRVDTVDWRFSGLQLTTHGHTTGTEGPRHPGGIEFANTSSDNLLIDLDFFDLGTTVVILGGERNGIFDNQFHRFGRLAMFGNDNPNRQHSIVGNRVYDIQADQREHVLRIQQGDHIFVGMNHFQATDTKTNIQVRGNSHDIVVYGNVLDRENGFNPQNTNEEEYVHHCVFDSNVVYGHTDPSYTTEFPVRNEAVGIKATHITVRNNVFYNYLTGMNVGDHPLVGGSDNVWIYNNTFFCIDVANDPCRGMRFEPETTNVQIWNNAFINPGNADPQTEQFIEVREQNELAGTSDFNLVYGAGWPDDHEPYVTDGGSYTLDAWQEATGHDMASINADPQLSSYYLEEEEALDWNLDVSDLGERGQWAPMSSSPLVDAGTRRGAALDIYGRLRRDSPDIGAVEAE